jgi:hypothetical protein
MTAGALHVFIILTQVWQEIKVLVKTLQCSADVNPLHWTLLPWQS